jgi:hypothetical protein
MIKKTKFPLHNKLEAWALGTQLKNVEISY